jgi:pilus assembly protein CpaB
MPMGKEEKEVKLLSQLRLDRRILLIAAACGLVSIVLVFFYLRSKTRAYGEPVPVLMAAVDIQRGDALKKDLLKVEKIAKSFVTPNAIGPEYLTSILDVKAFIPISAGQQILWSYIQTEKTTGFLSDVLNKEQKERAVTIAIDEISGIAGHITPNDRVDVIGTFTLPGTRPNQPSEMRTKTILQCVTVLAVGAAGAGGADQARGGYAESATSVTLRLNPEEAELLAFAESNGRLRLLLRNRDDLSVDEQIPVINSGNLFEIEKQQTAKRKSRIDIIYGIQKR